MQTVPNKIKMINKRLVEIVGRPIPAAAGLPVRPKTPLS